MMTLILIIENMNIDIDIIDISDHLNGDIDTNHGKYEYRY